MDSSQSCRDAFGVLLGHVMCRDPQIAEVDWQSRKICSKVSSAIRHRGHKIDARKHLEFTRKLSTLHQEVIVGHPRKRNTEHTISQGTAQNSAVWGVQIAWLLASPMYGSLQKSCGIAQWLFSSVKLN
ncbi:hypothetical protein GOBAR_DD14345 [Gossypium barbadense]|nr:hypothetical protein GOBAR_DD14345 [Gossypium barbadense]